MTEAIHVNFTDDEANAEAVLYDALPSGEYPVSVMKCELKRVKEGENAGKPYYNVQLKIHEGNKYQNRVLFCSVMLFDGALQTLGTLMKAKGLNPRTDPVPSADQIIGSQLIAVVAKVKDNWKMKGQPAGTPIEFKNDVKGFRSINGTVSSGNTPAAQQSNSLLP